MAPQHAPDQAAPDIQPAPALRIEAASKTYAGTPALRGVSLDVQDGTVHGLLGGNGSGKSTLIKILAGVCRADRGGSVTVGTASIPLERLTPAWAAEHGLRFVHQDLGLFPDMTVAENLAVAQGFSGHSLARVPWRRIDERAQALLDRYAIDAGPRQPLGDLPPSQRTLVAVARALGDEHEAGDRVLILDEPTARLPAAEAESLLSALRSYAGPGRAIVLVTHRTGEVLRAVDAVSVLRDGSLVSTRPRVGLTGAALVDLITGRAAGPPAVRHEPDAARGGQPSLSVRGLTCGRVDGVSLDLWPGEIVGVAGIAGSGRSTLLRALFGALPVRAGEVSIEGRDAGRYGVPDAVAAGLVYVPEDRPGDAAFIDLPVRHNLTAADVTTFWRGGRLRHAREGREAERAIGDFLIRAGGDMQPMSTLSGGNQQKAILARWMRGDPKVLLLDEPTQGVDVGARADIHDLIRRAADRGACALVVSSDFEELAALCDRFLILRGGRLEGELPGTATESEIATLAMTAPEEEHV